MKQVVKVLIVLALVFMLTLPAGCSNETKAKKDSSYSSAEKATDEPTEAPTEEPTEPETEEPETEKEEPTEEEEEEPEEAAHSTFSDVDWESIPTNEFILSDSYHTMMSERHVSRLSLKQLNVAINEIYARHGRIFKDDELRKYFESTSWYNGTVEPEDFSESWFNDVEEYNVSFLRDYYSRRESGEAQQYYGSNGSNNNSNNNNNNSNNNNNNYYYNNTPQDCAVCGGLGDCINCGGTGNCQHCFGKREVACIYCNHGKCGACFDGYVYKYVGLEVKKVPCDICKGYDACRYCGGNMRMPCNFCNAYGTCSECGGTGLCRFCNGTGH